MARTVITNALLLDMETGDARPRTSVVVDGDRIVDVGNVRAALSDAVEIDAKGRTLMPGLIDAHAHAMLTSMDLESLQHQPLTLTAHQARVGLEAMANRGFTTVRDAGGADHGMARAVESGLIKGPRLFTCGRMLTQTGGHGDLRPIEGQQPPETCTHSVYGFSHIADGVDAVRKAAREELRRGATQLKIMASGGVASPRDPLRSVQYSPQEISAVVEEAVSWGTYVMAHAYAPEAIGPAVRAGVRSIEHGNLLDESTARLMANLGAILVPTLVTYVKLAELGPGLGLPDHSLRKLDEVIDQGLDSLRIAKGAGVQIGLGTDLLGEAQAHQSEELAIRAKVLDPLEVLRSATVVNARLLERPGELGVITPGASADILLVDGNPLDDITRLTGQGDHIDLVMRGGEVLKSKRGS